jgi:DNA-binding GntR family transcriptional regulator
MPADPVDVKPVAFVSIPDGRPRVTKKDQLVDELRRLIRSGEIERGSRIRQDDLAARFDTSITPVREALRQLEAEGLLVSEPHRGVRVASADLESIKGTYIIRRLVEPYVMQRATRRISRRDLEQVIALNERMRTTASEDVRAMGELNHEFHQFFFHRCGIPSLTGGMMNLWPAFPADMFEAIPERALASVEEHDAILAAVAAGDLELVRATVDTHIARSYAALATRLAGPDGWHDPFDLDVD